MVAAPEEIKEFVRRRHRGLADASSSSTTVDGSSETGTSTSTNSAPTRARAHHVLIFGRKFYLEDSVKVVCRKLAL